MITDQMKKVIAKIEVEKIKVAAARDNIRELHDELSSLLECFDCGEEGLDNAIRELTDAVDKISEVV